MALAEAFGWENNEALQQHDVAELTRVLVEALEQSLHGTEYDSAMEEFFFGVQNTVVTCSACNESRIRQDKFLDLGLQIKGRKGVEESLKEIFSFEQFTGDNQLTCDSEKCQGVKTDSSKGININRLPMALTLCLHRWELDYETWQRKKLDDRFEYPLELNMLDYLSEEAKMQYTAPEDYIYELKSIVIHRGGGYGGHYFAYIKDDLGEGTWHLEQTEEQEFEAKPMEVKVKKFDQKEHMTEQMIEELEAEKNKNNPKKNTKKKKKEKKEKDIVELDFSKCDFPIPYSS